MRKVRIVFCVGIVGNCGNIGDIEKSRKSSKIGRCCIVYSTSKNAFPLCLQRIFRQIFRNYQGTFDVPLFYDKPCMGQQDASHETGGNLSSRFLGLVGIPFYIVP